MIPLDANVFLRALTGSVDVGVQSMNEQAAALFRNVERGDVEVTASDAVIAEVAFILTSKAHYRLTVDDAAGRLTALVQIRGVKLRQKRVILHALELWAAYPRLGFVDALTAAQAQQPGFDLATFDSDFDELSGITRSRFEPIDFDGEPAP